ncbi:hypothetical protein FHR95_002220 [Halomonas fontilapidosi]|uniref:DUF945 domain-containing protein n=1 Tax=Halomonas fontilapidosi TaxID=616675 RepID=A0A7W5DKN4_9GAMM|nr:DUF945 family protein [Halomonas fontilapidosi]MBB3184646.1 hypothetical protein [Halomonas fontilapidosi]
MRKERLIVPLLVGLALLWAIAQYLSSVFFERELARALDDLAARGELAVTRSDVDQGWLESRGTLHLTPRFGQAWSLELPYVARHGVISTRIDGELKPHLGPGDQSLFGDTLPSSPPTWQARYSTLSATLQGRFQLAPFVVSQAGRELEFRGGRITFGGVYGDWRLQASLAPWRLSDGPATLEVGPTTLESRYAYTEEAYHFTQQDLLKVERLAWHQPDRDLVAHELLLHSRTELDDQELRVESELTLDRLVTAEQVLLTGRIALELSRINADALRSALAELRDEAARGDAVQDGHDLLVGLEAELLAMLRDSPRLDIHAIALDSPMLGLEARGDGALFFDSRQLSELSLAALDDPRQQARWRERLYGDLTWHEVPKVVALWLGLPLDTRDLEIDVVGGRVRVNGRPLPPVFERLQ